MEEERDSRFSQLSMVGAGLNVVAVIFSLIALATNHWATLEVVSFAAGAFAVVTSTCLAVAVVMAPLVVSMHASSAAVCLKFRHAIFTRLVATSAAAFFSLLACICFYVESSTLLPLQTDSVTASLGWSFYLEVATLFVTIMVALCSSYEWRWSRKLGGDPTVYARDPHGHDADTIVNQNFREAPRHPQPPKGAPRGDVHRNKNGVAMTTVSGLPYSMVNGRGLNGQQSQPTTRVAATPARPGTPTRGVRTSAPPNGHRSGAAAVRIAFDPSRTPIRSSLRRPKPAVAEDVADAIAAAESGVVQNPAFAPASPAPKKKVRIHTQSTAV